MFYSISRQLKKDIERVIEISKKINNNLIEINCPRCTSKNMIKYESKSGNELECQKCGSQFYEKDLLEIKNKSAILTIQEKLKIVKVLSNQEDTSDNT